jgi:hypothetical protein
MNNLNLSNEMDPDMMGNGIFDMYSFIYYVQQHYKQWLLLLSVFVIIYLVDYVTRLNSQFYGVAFASNIYQSISTQLKKKKKERMK